MLKKMVAEWKQATALWRLVAILEVIVIGSVLGILIALPNYNIAGPLCILCLVSIFSAYIVCKIAMKHDHDEEGEQM